MQRYCFLPTMASTSAKKTEASERIRLPLHFCHSQRPPAKAFLVEEKMLNGQCSIVNGQCSMLITIPRPRGCAMRYP